MTKRNKIEIIIVGTIFVVGIGLALLFDTTPKSTLEQFSICMGRADKEPEPKRSELLQKCQDNY